ncbi:hypothetical protein MKW94_021534 [Papaver nudicaule]|uniref:Auxin-responsive protein n=1 Tax=Papaver nudicaule TaxID=74823 RepID=A0AA42B5I3_PAPNU|nr:hypothetical protein [Papaver nudicaule]
MARIESLRSDTIFTELSLGLPGATPNNKKRVFSDIVDDEENNSGMTEEYPRKQNKTSSQVVGWPPVCSYRKKSKTSVVVDSNASLSIKVSMDGAPYLRKIDLNVHKGYTELAVAFEKLFGCFGTGQDSEYISIYEDKDGDWMLVGDVPYKMFTESCKRLRIMKRSEATGLGLTL